MRPGPLFESSSEDITLFKSRPGACSARNPLICTVFGLFETDNRIGVELDHAGQTLISRWCARPGPPSPSSPMAGFTRLSRPRPSAGCIDPVLLRIFPGIFICAAATSPATWPWPAMHAPAASCMK